MELLINQVGYQCDGEKIALLQSDTDLDIRGHLRLLRQDDERILLEVPLQPVGQVEGWQGRHYWRADFSPAKSPATTGWRPHPDGCQGAHRAHRPFTIGEDLLASRCLSDVIHYFRQRASGAFDRADRSARLFGSDQRKDVHGGWYDASGDVSKYLSHLSYANYLNPSRPPWWSGPCSSVASSWPLARTSTGSTSASGSTTRRCTARISSAGCRMSRASST